MTEIFYGFYFSVLKEKGSIVKKDRDYYWIVEDRLCANLRTHTHPTNAFILKYMNKKAIPRYYE